MAGASWRRLRRLDETLTAQPSHALVGVLRIPHGQSSPGRIVYRRTAIALAALLVSTLLVYVDRDGYRDVQGDRLSFLDCLYYSAVTLSTTGYGDITPVTEFARMINVAIITPLRIAFLILSLGVAWD